MSFLTELYELGHSFSAINTAKSALLSIVSVDGKHNWNENPDIRRFCKGVFNIKPPSPKYFKTWDADTLVKFLEFLGPLDSLSLKELTLKTLGLIALTSGNRAQSIHLMNTEVMAVHSNYYSFGFTQNIKTSRPGKPQQSIEVHKFNNVNCCAFTTMAEYLKRTDSLRSTSHLWISFKKPFKAVGRQTISRWLKTLLHMAGLDISIFTGHSTRMAATSKVNNMGVGLHTILATAGWNSESNFKKFYLRDKLGESDNAKKAFAEAVLTV